MFVGRSSLGIGFFVFVVGYRRNIFFSCFVYNVEI